MKTKNRGIQADTHSNGLKQPKYTNNVHTPVASKDANTFFKTNTNTYREAPRMKHTHKLTRTQSDRAALGNSNAHVDKSVYQKLNPEV